MTPFAVPHHDVGTTRLSGAQKLDFEVTNIALQLLPALHLHVDGAERLKLLQENY